MKQPPWNKDVPKHVWEEAEHDYKIYLEKRDILMGMGLSDEAADEYLDAYDELQGKIELLDTLEPDFTHSDHTRDLVAARDIIERFMVLLGSDIQPHNELTAWVDRVGAHIDMAYIDTRYQYRISWGNGETDFEVISPNFRAALLEAMRINSLGHY